MPFVVGTAALFGEAVHRAELPGRRICVSSDAQEPCSQRLHGIDVSYTKRLPALGVAGVALPRALVHEDDLHPRSRRSMAVGLDDSFAPLVAESEDRPTPDRFAEALVTHSGSRPPAFAYGALDHVRSVRRRVVLPDPDDAPSCGSERVIDGAITLNIPCELGLPVLHVHRGSPTVLRTSMPEATIDEHGHPPSRKDYVRADAAIDRLDGVVNAEAKAPPVQFAAERKLGLGVPTRAAPHRR